MSFLNKSLTVLVLASLSLGMLTLEGCAQSKKSYLQQSGSTPPIILPKGIHTHPLENQFPIPAVRHADQPAPSLLPPGSDLALYAPKKKHHHF
jgi:uncharacterized lipoprotein